MARRQRPIDRVALRGALNSQDLATVCQLFKSKIKYVAHSLANHEYGEQDLIQDGYIGLLIAVQKYRDDTRILKFITYASKWIHGQMQAASFKWNNIMQQQVFPEKNSQGYWVIDLRPYHRGSKKHLRKFMATPFARPLLLDAKVQDDDGDQLRHEVVASDTPSTEDLALIGIAKARLPWALCELTSKQHEIIRLRYGLNDNRPLSQQKVAKRLGTSKSNVHQMEHVALGKLRKTIDGV